MNKEEFIIRKIYEKSYKQDVDDYYRCYNKIDDFIKEYEIIYDTRWIEGNNIIIYRAKNNKKLEYDIFGVIDMSEVNSDWIEYQIEKLDI